MATGLSSKGSRTPPPSLTRAAYAGAPRRTTTSICAWGIPPTLPSEWGNVFLPPGGRPERSARRRVVLVVGRHVGKRDVGIRHRPVVADSLAATLRRALAQRAARAEL